MTEEELMENYIKPALDNMVKQWDEADAKRPCRECGRVPADVPTPGLWVIADLSPMTWVCPECLI